MCCDDILVNLLNIKRSFLPVHCKYNKKKILKFSKYAKINFNVLCRFPFLILKLNFELLHTINCQ